MVDEVKHWYTDCKQPERPEILETDGELETVVLISFPSSTYITTHTHTHTHNLSHTNLSPLVVFMCNNLTGTSISL